jgi:hypothetical protein
MDWTTGVWSPAGEEGYTSILCIQTNSGAHPASYPMDTRGKARLGHDTDHSPPSSAKVKNK